MGPTMGSISKTEMLGVEGENGDFANVAALLTSIDVE